MRTALVLLLILASCSEDTPIEQMVTSRVARTSLYLPTTNNLDVLFVIDTSPTMAAQRAHLDTALPELVRVLETLPRGVPDLHLGVITADVGATGTSGCTTDGDDGRMSPRGMMTGPFLSDTVQAVGTRTRNYTGTLRDAFFAYASVGAQGCSVSRPFEAVRRALDPTRNPGFSRTNAYLAVVFVTASDDASTGEIASYVQTLKAHLTDPSNIVVTAIAGPRAGTSSCGAGSAPRLHALLDQFPNRSNAISICDADLSPAFVLISQLQRTVLGIQCWEPELVDADLDLAGHQFACAAQIDYATGESATLPECTVSPATASCWRIVEDSACRFGPGSGLTTRIEPMNVSYPHDAQAWIECLVVDPTVENP